MNAIENQVRQLVDVELAAANERFPQFHSAHEGYAVILEEVDELEGAVYATKASTDFAWAQIKCDIDTGEDVQDIMKYAINAACEAIQVAAMCKKFLEMGAEK